MTLCFKCERYYLGSYGAHWRFAHQVEEEDEGRILRFTSNGTPFLGDK